MTTLNLQQQKYIAATLLGAIVGGILVALATKAVPRIMSGMMKNMMQSRGENGSFPEI